VPIPDVGGLDEPDAVDVLIKAGLTPGKRNQRFHPEVALGRVITTVNIPDEGEIRLDGPSTLVSRPTSGQRRSSAHRRVQQGMLMEWQCSRELTG
jgi:hypothetical protein